MRSALVVIALAMGADAAAADRHEPSGWCCTADPSCLLRCSPPPPPLPYDAVAAARSSPPRWAAPPTVREVGDHWLVVNTGLGAASPPLRLQVDVANAAGATIFQGDQEAVEADGSADICWRARRTVGPYSVRLRLVDAAGRTSPEVVLEKVGEPLGPPPPAAIRWLQRYLLFVALPFYAGHFLTALWLRRRGRRIIKGKAARLTGEQRY